MTATESAAVSALGCAPALFGLGGRRGAEREMREARGRDAVADALRDARYVPRGRVATGEEDRPAGRSEIEGT